MVALVAEVFTIISVYATLATRNVGNVPIPVVVLEIAAILVTVRMWRFATRSPATCSRTKGRPKHQRSTTPPAASRHRSSTAWSGTSNSWRVATSRSRVPA